jgi:hypothetical protein
MTARTRRPPTSYQVAGDYEGALACWELLVSAGVFLNSKRSVAVFTVEFWTGFTASRGWRFKPTLFGRNVWTARSCLTSALASEGPQHSHQKDLSTRIRRTCLVALFSYAHVVCAHTCFVRTWFTLWSRCLCEIRSSSKCSALNKNADPLCF